MNTRILTVGKRITLGFVLLLALGLGLGGLATWKMGGASRGANHNPAPNSKSPRLVSPSTRSNPSAPNSKKSTRFSSFLPRPPSSRTKPRTRWTNSAANFTSPILSGNAASMAGSSKSASKTSLPSGPSRRNAPHGFAAKPLSNQTAAVPPCRLSLACQAPRPSRFTWVYAGGAEAGVGGVFVPAGGAEGAVAGGVDAGGVQAVEGGVLSQSAQSSDTEGTEVGGGSLLRVEGAGIGRKEAQEAQKRRSGFFHRGGTESEGRRSFATECTELGHRGHGVRRGSLLRFEGSGIGRKEAQEAQKTEERIFFTAETRSRRGDGVLSQSAQNSDTEHGDRIFLTAKGAKGREG